MRFLVALLLLAPLAACATGGDSPGAAPSSSPSQSALPGAPPSADVGPQPDRSSTPACAEVRAGIDAFNAGDFEGTVSHFRTAVPLARKQAAGDGSTAAKDLLEAVRYYADLAPGDYPQSAASSPQFAKYKAITLGQCVAGADEPSQESQSPGVTT